jgi:hypothetical protein
MAAQPIGGYVLTVAEARSRVAKGAALLDDKRPGWADRIDLASLDMGCCSQCVLGQVFGSFFWAASGFWPIHDLKQRAEEHGFDLNTADADSVAAAEEEWTILRNAWVGIIQERRSPPALAVSNLAELLGVA